MIESITTVGPAPRPLLTSSERLQARVMRAVGKYGCFLPGNGRGCASWWLVKTYLGGSVPLADVRAAVDALLASGALVELWLDANNGRAVPHVLCLPERVRLLTYPVQTARGRPELLAEKLPHLRSDDANSSL